MLRARLYLVLFAWCIAGVAAADAPVPEVYEVLIDEDRRGEALVFHWDQVASGFDPESGREVIAGIPAWQSLKITGDRYEFRIKEGYDDDPWTPIWILTLDRVSFSWPTRVSEAGLCRTDAREVVLKRLPDAVPDCSIPEGRQSPPSEDEIDPCWEAYQRNYHECDSLFPKLEDKRPALAFEDIQGRPFVRVDWSQGDRTIQACMGGELESCSRVFSRYADVRPDQQEETGCDIGVPGREGSRWADVDEVECQFHAYYDAIGSGCRPPECGPTYRWRGSETAPVANAHWRPVPFPPPLDRHHRLFPKPVPGRKVFLDVVEQCRQMDEDACLAVERAYDRLRGEAGYRTNCYLEIAGARDFIHGTMNERECLFRAFMRGLRKDCRTPECDIRYLWQQQRTVPDSELMTRWPSQGWKELPVPPPLHEDRRLVDGSGW